MRYYQLLIATGLWLILIVAHSCVVQWKTTDTVGIEKQGAGTKIGLDFLNKKVDTVRDNTLKIKEMQDDFDKRLAMRDITYIDSLRKRYNKDSAFVIKYLIAVLEDSIEFDYEYLLGND